VSVASAARLTGRSYPAARGAVRALEEKGVLFQSSKNRKSGLYAAREVLDEFTLYERSLATPLGDTRAERPSRRVPQRP
jgi:molybdenum-dependent DNA-binding transcriptional regulator ModE